jgi:hypothetical protein
VISPLRFSPSNGPFFNGSSSHGHVADRSLANLTSANNLLQSMSSRLDPIPICPVVVVPVILAAAFVPDPFPVIVIIVIVFVVVVVIVFVTVAPAVFVFIGVAWFPGVFGRRGRGRSAGRARRASYERAWSSAG